jgi:hypothetical protein
MEKLSREKILDIVGKLMSKTEERGATPAEAAAAMEAAMKMLNKHGLSMMDVESLTLKKEVKLNVTQETYDSVYTNIPDYISRLCMKIAKAFDCQFILGYAPSGKGRYIFVGEELDSAVALYLSMRTADELYEWAGRDGRALGYKGAALSRFRKEFFTGAIDEIQVRLEAMRKSEAAQSQSLGALIIIKKDVVDEWLKVNIPDLKKGKALAIKVGRGTTYGRDAGKQIDLSMSGIKGRSTPSPRIGG